MPQYVHGENKQKPCPHLGYDMPSGQQIKNLAVHKQKQVFEKEIKDIK